MEERLQKLIAQAGIASRRHAEDLIKEGAVTVNGKVVTELGTKADPERDHIKVQGKLINIKLKEREKVYVLLYKPKGYLTSVSDPQKRKLVTDLVASSFGKLHPVGRLDLNTEGLLLLTNDGDFTNFITSAKNRVPKVYEVKVKGIPPPFAIHKLQRGVTLEDGFKTASAEIEFIKETKTNAWFQVTLYEGHNLQIRKMFDLIRHSVVKLKRTGIGHLKNETLRIGEYRLLQPHEVKRFKRKEKRDDKAQAASQSKSKPQKKHR